MVITPSSASKCFRIFLIFLKARALNLSDFVQLYSKIKRKVMSAKCRLRAPSLALIHPRLRDFPGRSFFYFIFYFLLEDSLGVYANGKSFDIFKAIYTSAERCAVYLEIHLVRKSYVFYFIRRR